MSVASAPRPASPPGAVIRRRDVPADVGPLHADALAHRILAARGIADAQQLDLGLARLPAPDALPDIDRAVTRLLRARDAGERLTIVGDYDCDGATSSAVAVLGLTMLGFEPPRVRVPNRFEDGYGLSAGLVAQLLDQAPAPQLILTVDNGIAAVEGVAAAAAAGVDVVVTDHHLPPHQLPAACALVNPNRDGSTFPSRALAGVGVVFYLLLAIRARLRARGLPADAPLADLLDLVAIGTVADVVPLDAVNRALVWQGIRRIRAGRTRPGVLALLKSAARDPARLETDDIGFALGPRLNAAGRLADMATGIACLLAETPREATRLANELDGLNRERRRIEQGMREEAELRLANSEAVSDGERLAEQRFGVVLADAGWHEGVIGILAGRLKERLHRPVVAMTHDDLGRLKGSARSIPGVHVRDVLQAIDAQHPGLLIAFGGHAMAAGMTIQAHSLELFSEAFDTGVRRALLDRLPEREWLTDGALPRERMTLATARLLAELGPYGQGFEAPVFDGRFTVVERRLVGTGHLKLIVTPVGAATGADLDAIAFNRTDELAPGDAVRLVYRLDINVWRDSERLQLRIDHLQPDSP